MKESNSSRNTSSRHAARAGTTTAFSRGVKHLMVPICITAVAAVFGSPLYVSVLPYLGIMTYMIRSEPGETVVQYWWKYFIVQFFFGGFLLVASFVIFFPVFGFVVPITGYHGLCLYLPMITISVHDRRQQYGVVGTFILTYFFDWPLVIAGYVCREYFNLRVHAPFCTIFDMDMDLDRDRETKGIQNTNKTDGIGGGGGRIIQGSLPFPSDIPTLANAHTYNVGMIVNLCREYPGATTAMKQYGLVQVHLPTQDTTAVSYDTLVTGCQYIRQYQKHHPTKRIYIHCKGGIARASTMTLAHYIVNENLDPTTAMTTMKAQRPIVLASVKNLPAIVRLNDERLRKQQQNEDNQQ